MAVRYSTEWMSHAISDATFSPEDQQKKVSVSFSYSGSEMTSESDSYDSNICEKRVQP